MCVFWVCFYTLGCSDGLVGSILSIIVDVAYWGVGVVVLWSVELCIQEDERVHLCAYS